MKKKLLSMLLVSLFLSHFLLASASQSPTVIAIGAGISGIAAAKTLHEAGIQDILILEGSGRIGGRLMKAEFSGVTVEVGGTCPFGGGHNPNPLLDIAKKLKLKTYTNDYGNVTANVLWTRWWTLPKKSGG